MPRTSVVILNWNGERFLRQFLPSVVQHTPSEIAQVVVADNGSTDQSLDYVRQHWPTVRIIAMDRNHGFTGGYNLAMEQIDTEYTVLLNSDVEVKDNWLAPLVTEMDAHPTLGACMPKLLWQENTGQFEYAGAAGGYIDALGYPFCRGRMLGTIEADHGQYNHTHKVFWASGACMMVRTALYKELGGLDPDFFAHMEEIDLCWRMQHKGYHVRCVPASQVYHVGGGTLPNNTPRKLYLNYRNNLLMLYKNLPATRRYPTLLLRMGMDHLSAWVYLATGQWGFFKSVFKAHWHFLKLRKGKKAKGNKPLRQLHGMYPGSMLIAYFVQGKNTFGELWGEEKEAPLLSSPQEGEEQPTKSRQA